MARFQRLLRFEDLQGQIQHGELGVDTTGDSEFVGIEVPIYVKDVAPWSDKLQLTGETAKVARVGLTLYIKNPY